MEQALAEKLQARQNARMAAGYCWTWSDPHRDGSLVGAKRGTKAAFAALKKLPGRVLIEINKKVGFRLLTKFGTTGVINLGRAVPVVGGGVSAVVNAGGMQTVGRYAKRNFPKT